MSDDGNWSSFSYINSLFLLDEVSSKITHKQKVSENVSLKNIIV